jgi:hypothetical protein
MGVVVNEGCNLWMQNFISLIFNKISFYTFYIYNMFCNYPPVVSFLRFFSCLLSNTFDISELSLVSSISM